MPNPTPQPDIDELRERLNEIVGTAVVKELETGRWYTNWRTRDEQDQWTVADFHPITWPGSVGNIAATALDIRNAILKELTPLLTTHTEKAISAAREDNFIAKLQTYSITDQQLILGGLIYKYFMLATNATKVTMTLGSFSHKDKVLGDLVIKAELQATTSEGGEDE